jgi:hypothetical protein
MTMSVARVAIQEAEMLAVARALVTPDSYASIEATLGSQLTVNKVGPSGMRVLEDTLAKGVVKTLARLGGARPRIRPGGDGNKPVRVFEVRGTPKLSFSPYTFELLRWLTNTPLHAKDSAKLTTNPRTLGDEVIAYLTLRLVEGRRLERVVASSPGVRSSFTWLGFVRPLARHSSDSLEPPTIEKAFSTEDRKIVLECLAGDLTRRWLTTIVWDEHDILDPDQAMKIGTFERAILTSYLDTVEKTNRWDLATFIVEAGTRALPKGAAPKDIAGRVSPRVRAEGTLRARTEARRRAGALFQALGRLAKKRDELALVRFMDDDYEIAQKLLSAWEMLPREAFTRAEGVLTALDALEDPNAANKTPPAEAST